MSEEKQSAFAEHAWKFIERGISVVPIAPGSKKPGQWSAEHGWRGMPDWTKYAQRMPTEIELAYWNEWPEAGIGVVLGKLSNLIGLDKDYDLPDKGNDALQAIIPFSPVAKKGEKGWTKFYQYNGERSCSFDVNGVRVLDILSEGRQTVVPPTAHPSGCSYVWITADSLAEITSATDLPKLPDDFIAQVERLLAQYQTDDDKKYQKKKIAPREDDAKINTELSISAQYYRDINRMALDNLESWVEKLIPTAKQHNDGYRAIATWRGAKNPNVGIHPHGIMDWGGNYGMTPIDLVMYARQLPFVKAAEALRGCLSFNEPEPIVFGSIKPSSPTAPAVKPTLPWLKPPTVEPPAPLFVPSDTSVDLEAAVPAFILNPPGILGEIARWITATAPKEQPELAVAAAIALASVVMGRSYKTQFNNFTSLYLVMVAKSTEGKEHPQSAIEQVLTAANLTDLLGGSGYTSAGGVHSALLKSPCHIVMIDEMGKLLKLSRVKGNTNSEAAIDKLVEAFGRLGGIMRPPTYSSMTLSKSQTENTERIVHNPAITLLGATTPGTFYENLSNDLVKDGFLGRCIVVESKRPRQLTQFVPNTPPPARVVDWCKTVHISAAAQGGDLAAICMAEMPATTIEMRMTDECQALLKEIDKAMNDAKDEAEKDGLDMVLGRTVEKAMRLALIVAKARDKNAREVKYEDLKWAVEYVQHYDMELVRAVKDKRFENEHQQNVNKVLDYMRRAKSLAKSTKNKTYAEIMRANGMPHSFLLQRMNMESKRLSAIIDTLIESEQVTFSPSIDGDGVFKGRVYYLAGE